MNCTIIGAGAIGKAVAGWAFSAMGASLTFIDAQENVVADLNRRGGYRIYESVQCWHTVSPVRAVGVLSPEARACLEASDCVVTAVGPGLESVSRMLAEALGERARPCALLLFENDPSALSILESAFGGRFPENLCAAKASIERMSRIFAQPDGSLDVLCEDWIPIILPQSLQKRALLPDDPRLFQFVEDTARYYYRKLYTNNLGHAVLGFQGRRAGWTTASEAIGDPAIRAHVRRALEEAGVLLVRRYGFEATEMEAHIEDLISRRYANPALADPLDRLVRDPARKLSRDERLIGAARGCLECGIMPVEILRTIRLAMASLKMPEERILAEICDIDPNEPLWAALMNSDTQGG